MWTNHNSTWLWTTTINIPRHFSLNLLLHSSNFLMVARTEVKISTHGYYIISMTIIYMFPWRLHIVWTTNSLRQFSLTVCMEIETWYTCVLHHFHNKHMLPWQPHIVRTMTVFFLLLHSSNLDFTSGTPGNNIGIVWFRVGVSACSNLYFKPCFMYPIPILPPFLFTPSLYASIFKFTALLIYL